MWPLLALLACTDPEPTLAPDAPAEPAPVATVALPDVPEWSWEGTASPFPDEQLVSGDVRLSIPDPETKALTLSNGELWSVDPGFDRHVGELGRAAMVVHDGQIFVAHHNRISTGCELAAYSLETGERLWHTHLEGVGPVSHSRYSNQIELRVLQGAPTVFGDESAGRYVEMRDPDTGELVHNVRVEE